MEGAAAEPVGFNPSVPLGQLPLRGSNELNQPPLRHFAGATPCATRNASMRFQPSLAAAAS